MTAIRRTRPMPLAAKIGATAAIVLLAQVVFADESEVGGTLAAIGLAWIAALALTRPIVLRGRGSRIALGAAAGFALVLIDDPNPLALLMGWVALSLAALLPRGRFGHALLWARRLAWHAVIAVALPWRDMAWASFAERRRKGGGLRAAAAMLVVPVIGGALFLALFASANPLIGNTFARITLPDMSDAIWRTLLAAFVLTGVWATLRPRLKVRATDALDEQRFTARLDLGVAGLVLSLATFNAIFALQNVLDILFLWNGAALPDGVTMAAYAHRGAYALIVTALLAALFVLVTLRPGGAGAASPTVRRLVTLWIGQNVLLVASSGLRLADYIAAYGMTTLRLAALAWMALVATGLALILWRLLRARSAAWLINANALAATIVLSGASVVDLGATAAAWNVRVALRDGRAGPPLDLCYLARLGPSGLVALARLERHAKDAGVRDRLAYLRWETQAATARTQADWRSWSGRDARRLATVEASVGAGAPRLRAAPDGRLCDGRIIPPPPPALTKAPQR